MHLRSMTSVAFVGALLAMAVPSGGAAAASGGNAAVIAQAHGTEQREIEPRYQPVPPEEKCWYNSQYLLGLSRATAGSTLAPAAKAPLFVLTLPLDLALLPFAAIGGLFGGGG